ncbi:MAG: hypothetical protein AAFX53_07915 [Bacteroidota bacterium]
MRSKNILLALALLSGTFFFAQDGPGRERIRTLKVAFITERLNLSSKEAQVFWPVYNEHEQQLEALRKRERVEIRGQLRNLDQLSEKEISILLDELIAIQEKKQQQDTDFIKQIKKLISPKKTLLLLKAEEDFKRRLLKEMRNRRRGQ